jgi:hypothetical protein
LQLSVGGLHIPQVQVLVLHVRVPVDMQLVVQLPMVPAMQVNPSSMVVSQSSSMPLQASAGGAQPPHAQLELQVREPLEPHVVVHEPVAPAQQPNPSSHEPLQSSSMPLHVSAGGEHADHAHVGLQVRDPVDPQPVVHDPLDPAAHVKVSSRMPSQSSSSPLHASIGGVHVPQLQLDVQVREPVVPQLVVQEPDAPGTQVNVSSIRPSQSSSVPLHVSAGGVHAEYMHVALQVRAPVVPQLVVHPAIVPGEHSAVSSTIPSQSSSMPVHPSAGGVHVPSVQAVELHVRVPVDVQLVVHDAVEPAMQPNPSSAVPSQSSSAPLHVSAGGMHVLHSQLAPHVWVPVEPQDDVHDLVAPRTQAYTSSAAPLQSSSTPLHCSCCTRGSRSCRSSSCTSPTLPRST